MTWVIISTSIAITTTTTVVAHRQLLQYNPNYKTLVCIIISCNKLE